MNAQSAAPNTASREVVQPLPSQDVQRLNRALKSLARRPRQLAALLEAADASFAVGDYDAAIGFYGRAADLAPNDARVKLGTARVYLRSGRPVAALPLFAAAQAAGAPAGAVLTDRGLALDMVGQQNAAQTAYARALELDPQNDEARRRLALSQAIGQDADGFQDTLSPLLEARDFAAFRVRAFGLAILGEADRANAIVDAVMPPDLAGRITPYLAFMPRLTPAQQAAAANLGIFPRAADIGREDPRIARFASEEVLDRPLEPAGEPLGAPIETVSQEVTQAVPQAEAGTVAMAEVPANVEMEAASATGTTMSAALPVIETSEVGEPGTTTSAAARGAARVADVFADLDNGDLPVTAPSGEAVDIAAIEVPREAAPVAAPPGEPENPRRVWVQVATGQDLTALTFDWRRLTRRAPQLLGDYEPHTVVWGQANRLLAGPLDSEADARALVNALSAQGIDTFPYTSPEGTEIQALD